MKTAILFAASLILGPLALVAWLATPTSPLWLSVVSGGIAFVLGWVTLVAQWVRTLARLLRVVLVLLAFGLLAAGAAAMLNMVSWPWLIWPTLIAGLIVLIVSAFETPARSLRPRTS